MESLAYLHVQMRLEGLGLTQHNLLTAFQPKGHDPPPVFLAQTPDGQTVTYISQALPRELQEALVTCLDEVRFPDVEVILNLLRAYDIQPQVEHSKTYLFPERYAEAEVSGVKRWPKDDPRIEDFGFAGFADQVYVVEAGGAILSACVSARQNTECAEAWLFTAAEHRRKDLAQLVVTAWARDMMKAKLIPFYSHKMENIASARLANKLGLIPVFEEIVIEKKM